MENKDAIDLIPSRVKYYLLEWKDNNMKAYINKYGEVNLRRLSIEQLMALFDYAKINDIGRMINVS